MSKKNLIEKIIAQLHEMESEQIISREQTEIIVDMIQNSFKTYTESLRVIYSEDKNYAYFDGREYHRIKGGYYQRKLDLHVAVMENYIDKAVPKGYHVHHNGKDEMGNFDKNKNDIEHLLLLSSSEHRRLHNLLDEGQERTVICASCGKEFKTRDKQRLYCTESCRRKKERKRIKEFVCKVCGKKFLAPRGSKRKLCNEHTTANCKSIIE